MMDELSKLDEAAGRATTKTESASTNDRRVEFIVNILDEVKDKDKDRAQWTRQFADYVSAAAQTGTYPAGVDKLKDMLDRLDKNPAGAAVIPYLKFRYLAA